MNATVELYVYTENVLPGTPSSSFTITVVSTAFDASNNITTDFNSSRYQPTHNQVSSDWSGWDHVKSQNWLNAPVFASALFKFECPNHNFYFYLDYRDTRYPFLGPCTGQCADIWIWYDGSTEKFYISSYTAQTPYAEIHKGGYLTIWDLQGKGMPSTSDFQNYWSNCLSAVPHYNAEDLLVPLVVWGPIPNFTATGYKIYRRVSPIEQHYSLIAQVGSSQFTYSDNYVSVGGNKTAYYKVKAYNGSSESAFSNEASIAVTYANPGKRGGMYSNRGTTPFSVSQNYPNPFNPSTEIRYSLPKPSHVKIVVMNTVGQEVRTLVDAHQGEGKHSVAFHASELPSGVYFCKVYAGDFTAIKKMMYLR